MIPMLSYSRSILCPLLLTIMTLCFVHCKTENTTEVANNTTEKKDLSGDGISTLYQYYVENPQNQDHIDENMILIMSWLQGNSLSEHDLVYIIKY